MTYKYDESVEIGIKLASLCFKSIGKAHECHKYCVLLAVPIAMCDVLIMAHKSKEEAHLLLIQVNAGYT